MQKRVVYDFNAQTATESAAENSTDKAVKTSNAIGKIKRAFSGKSFKLVVLIVLLFASLFCAIGSADWIISQQKVVPNVAGNSIFKFDDLGFGAHVNNGKPTGNYTFNGSSISIAMSVAAVGGVQNLPDSAIEAQNIRYRVKKCAPDTKPENLNEEFFNSDYATVLPKYAGTYAVLITSEADGVSYGKTIKVFTIAPCPVKIEWSGAVGFTYDGTDHSRNITATARTENGAAVNENIFEISFSYKAHGATTFTPVTEVKNAGTYTATAEISNNNYTISSNDTATFTIGQKALTVTAENKTVTYGDSATYTATYKGLLDCDKGKLGTPNFTCNYNKVGTYPITVDGLENSNYAITYVNGKLTVNKRTVTLDWGTDNSFIYDGTARTLNPTAQNVVNNDNLGLTVTVTGENVSGSSAINVGTYTATASITNKNYVIDENNKSATFTITARALTITANNHEIIYGSAPATNGYTISGIEGETPETANIGGTVKLTTTYTQYGKVGEYDIIVDISGLSSSNYSFTAVNGKLTVNKKELTVTAKNHEITYGEEPSANGYTINGFVNNENESVIKGLENITYIIDYSQWEDIGKFSITPKVDGLSAVNYSFKANSDGILKVKQLNIHLSGIIERDYDGSEFLFDKNLFTTATATFTAPQNPGIDLKKLPYDIYQYISNAGNAQNFDSANGIAVTPENGLFSYAFGKPIEAGSTYKVDKVTLNNKNFNLTKTEVYLKYKTAKVGDKFYTIEDALAQSGTITLCGDASNDSSYVITAFAKLNNLSGTAFGNYKTNYEYTLKSNSTLLLPYNSDGLAINSDSDIINCATAPEYVYSVLIIPQEISFTISGTLDIGGRLSSKGGDFNQARVKQHSVVYNNGNIVVTNRINSYGYLKGANDGLVELQSTATALDIMRVYDWLAGTEAIQIHNADIFPFKSYSIHNISCKTKITKGAQYLAKAALNVQNMLLPSDPITIVGASGSMFTVESGYIVKTASNADSNKASTDLTSITGTNQLKGQKDIITLGENTVCHDNSITLTIKMAGFTKKITTSKDYPLPISYINLVVPNTATLKLNAVSYLFYLGSSLKVETGGNLVVEKVSVAFYTLNDCISDENWEKNRVKYATAEGTNDYAVDRTDAKLSIDAGGTATIKSNASISGCITATNSQAQLIINSSTSVTVKVPTDLIAHNVANDIDKGLIATGIIKASKIEKTYTAFGDIMTSQNSYTQRDLNAGTYYSTKIDSDYVWFKNSATITYHTNGGTLNGTSGNTTQNITLPSGGYISSNLPKPTLPYYEFNGWYYDSALTQKATAIFASCDLYAKWTPIQYTIVYNFPYDECGTLVNDSLSGTEVKTLATPRQQTITVDGTEYTFSGWYLNSDRTGDSITEVSAVNANKQNKINVYAFYRGGTYTVNYEEDPENLLHNNNLTAKKPESQTFDKGMAVSQSELQSLNSYNDKTSFMFYFAGWYLSTNSSKIITSLPSTIDDDITLCAKWIKKAQLKIELPVFENGNRTGNTTIYDTHKYFYKQKTDPIGIKNLLTYIGAGYTVPENYKFIGFNASSGFTATQDYSDMNNITTRIEVGATSDVLTITADIRKILTVTLTMDAKHKYFGQTKYFKITQVIISSNSMYSTDKSNWLMSNGSGSVSAGDRNGSATQKITFYLIEGTNANITVTVDSVTIAAITFYPPTPQVNNCTTSDKKSPFRFIIGDNDATISWT
ncbi:filamentous hemagglutinin family outer membrane protein [Acidiphilium sp. CAG:727]|nr:filamentous hemagglutinin family outer membrane protein [Acidiphilium sp. CAG:727]